MFTIASQKTGSGPVGNVSFILHFFGILPVQQFNKCFLASPSCVYVYLFVFLFVYFLLRCVWISICLLSLFIFCGSSRLASLSTPGWVGWMGLYTALLFFAVFLCDFYLDLCPSLVFSICAISMMYLLGCDGWEATVLCSPQLSPTY